jgi:hypothetical protein
MNKNELTNPTISYVIAITMLSAVAFVFVVSTELHQNAVGQADEVFNENATFIQELEGGSPAATANQTGESGAAATNQTGESGAAATNQTGESGAATNQTGESGAATNQTGESGAATNQTGESGAATNQTGGGGDILSSISEELKGLFGMK